MDGRREFLDCKRFRQPAVKAKFFGFYHQVAIGVAANEDHPRERVHFQQTLQGRFATQATWDGGIEQNCGKGFTLGHRKLVSCAAIDSVLCHRTTVAELVQD